MYNINHTANDIDFVIVQTFTTTPSVWEQITIDLSAYNGKQGYIAFHHHDTAKDELLIDDVTITAPSIDVVTVNNVTSPYTIEGLLPKTKYNVEVLAVYANGESAWATASFTTPSSITLADNDDNSEVITACDGLQLDVTVKRTLQTGGWNTFCVPFAIADPASVFGTGTEVKELSDAEYNDATKSLTLVFADAQNGIEAGKPYLVKIGSESNVDLSGTTFSDVSIVGSTTPTVINGIVTFVPVMNPEELTAGDKSVLFVIGGNTLTYPTANGSINGFRAYFKLANGMAGARAFSMSFGDETGIEEMEDGRLAIENSAGAVYDLQGRRMESSIFNSQSSIKKKGVYIVNGKKTVIK